MAVPAPPAMPVGRGMVAVTVSPFVRKAKAFPEPHTQSQQASAFVSLAWTKCLAVHSYRGHLENELM